MNLTLSFVVPPVTIPEKSSGEKADPASLEQAKINDAKADTTPLSQVDSQVDSQELSAPLEASTELPKTAGQAVTAVPQSPPLITPDTIRKVVRELTLGKSQTSHYSENHAVVFDKTLNSKLQAAREMPRAELPIEGSNTDSSFDGGSWRQRFEMNGLCFEVQLADPLDAWARDVWYRVSCPKQ